MNTRLIQHLKLAAAFWSCALLVATASTVTAAGGTSTNSAAKSLDKTPPAIIEPAKSMFNMPKNKSEGRDPFYPNSNYVYEQSSNKTGTKTAAPVAIDLVLKGIGGTPANRLATINTRTFSKGDDGEMNTSSGRVQIHIIDILEDAVILTVNGEQRELRFRRRLP